MKKVLIYFICLLLLSSIAYGADFSPSFDWDCASVADWTELPESGMGQEADQGTEVLSGGLFGQDEQQNSVLMFQDCSDLLNWRLPIAEAEGARSPSSKRRRLTDSQESLMEDWNNPNAHVFNLNSGAESFSPRAEWNGSDEEADPSAQASSSSAAAKNSAGALSNESKYKFIRENLEYQDFLLGNLPRFNWSLKKVGEEWNKDHPEEEIPRDTLQKYMRLAKDYESLPTMKTLAEEYFKQPLVGRKKNTIETTPGLKDFIKKKYNKHEKVRTEAKRLADLWHKEHLDADKPVTVRALSRYIKKLKDAGSSSHASAGDSDIEVNQDAGELSGDMSGQDEQQDSSFLSSLVDEGDSSPKPKRRRLTDSEEALTDDCGRPIFLPLFLPDSDCEAGRDWTELPEFGMGQEVNQGTEMPSGDTLDVDEQQDSAQVFQDWNAPLDLGSPPAEGVRPSRPKRRTLNEQMPNIESSMGALSTLVGGQAGQRAYASSSSAGKKYKAIVMDDAFKAFLLEKLPNLNWSLDSARKEWNKDHPEKKITLNTLQKYMIWAKGHEPSSEMKNLAEEYSKQPLVGHKKNKIESNPELKEFFDQNYNNSHKQITIESKRLAAMWNEKIPHRAEHVSYFVLYRYIQRQKSASGSSHASASSSAQDMDTSE